MAVLAAFVKVMLCLYEEIDDNRTAAVLSGLTLSRQHDIITVISPVGGCCRSSQSL